MTYLPDNSKPIRVLHIGKYFPPHHGGMETYLRDVMNVQSRQGINVMALVHSSKRSAIDIEESIDDLNGSTYQVIRSARWFTLGYIPISPCFIWSAFIAIKRFRPDLLHIHNPNSSAACLLLLPLARRLPWVIHWQSDIETPQSSKLMKVLYSIYRPIEQAVLSASHKIFVTSPTYAAHSAGLKNHMRKCALIPLGLDYGRLPAPHEVSPLPRPRDPLILFVGRLATYKGLTYLVKALQNLSSVHCWIAGDGECREEVQQLIQDLDLRERVKLLGAVSEKDKWALYKTCDLVVLPSTDKTEAFGMVILEAGHFNKKIVVTNIPGSGVPWVAKQILNCSVAEAADVDDLARTIHLSLKTYGDVINRELPTAFNLCSHVNELLEHYLGCLSDR